MNATPIRSAAPIQAPANGLVFTGLQWGPPDGTPVLLLHGFPQRATSWTGVAQRLTDIGLRSVAIDQRGYSPAARPTDVAAYAMGQLFTDVLELIAWLGAPVHLVGHDWGAVVGWQVATRRPDLLRSWTALSTPHPLALAAVLASSPEQRERFDYMRLFRQPGVAERALLDEDGAGLRAVYGGSVAPERVEADLAFFASPGTMTAALSWYRAMTPRDNDGLGPTTVATTYVWGSNDLAFGREAAEASGAWVSAPYSFLALEGASHWLPDEAPDAVAAAIAERALG